MAEKTICMSKDQFKAILTGVDKTFPMHLWNRLLPQAEITLDMLQPTNILPKISSNKMPLAPMVCAVLLYNKPDIMKTWDAYAID